MPKAKSFPLSSIFYFSGLNSILFYNKILKKNIISNIEQLTTNVVIEKIFNFL